MYTNKCITCQENFTVNRDSRKRKYCNSCKEKQPKPSTSKTCKNCQKNFATPTYHQRVKIFCSHSCSAEFNNKLRSKNMVQKLKTNIVKKNIEPQFCILCNTKVKFKKSKYCSKNCELTHKKKIKLDKFEKGELSSKLAKDILLENHGNICLNTTCAWDFTKKFVSVELEHIDGNSENNLPENLTLLCPNCHSLTSTY